MSKYHALATVVICLGLASATATAGSLVSDGDLDLDSYVTDKAIDGLFLKLADEEKKIRSDPLARSTELLKKVFSAASK